MEKAILNEDINRNSKLWRKPRVHNKNSYIKQG